MNLTIEVEREDDGRWIVEVPDLPGVLVYGATRAEAIGPGPARARGPAGARRGRPADENDPAS